MFKTAPPPPALAPFPEDGHTRRPFLLLGVSLKGAAVSTMTTLTQKESDIALLLAAGESTRRRCALGASLRALAGVDP